jgi:hypothetical protein
MPLGQKDIIVDILNARVFLQTKKYDKSPIDYYHALCFSKTLRIDELSFYIRSTPNKGS